MMKKYTLLLILPLLTITNLIAQNPGQQLFDNSYVHEIRITFDSPDFWETLNENYENSLDFEGVPSNVPYLEGNVNIDGNLLDDVGVRQKGFSSHFASNPFKKSLKLDFNEFVMGQGYDGMKKINLANGVGDPAMQRDVLAYNIMREAGIKAPRTSYAKVYLNNTYWGIYVIIEQIDKTFLENNFADDTGDLYKNISWSSLEWAGANQSNYSNSIALRTNETTSDFSDFIEFVDILNNTAANNFEEAITEVFNVDYYLRTLAVDVMTDNWDSYLEHGRNFYLYHEPASDQFFWIPWDYNLSMGGGFGGGDGYEIPDDPADCETIINGTSPYSATDPAFIATINDDSYCCNTDWDNICQGIYDDYAQNIEPLPDDPADCESILNGSCPYPADDPIFLDVIALNTDCCLEGWSGDCQAAYDDILNPTNAEYIDFPFIIDNPEKILIDKILAVDVFREQYLNYCCQILEHNFTTERLFPIVDYNGSLIANAVAEDNNYAFPIESFNYDISEGDGSSSIPSLKEFIDHRIAFLEQDLISLDHTCESTTTDLVWQDIVVNEFVASNDDASGILDPSGAAEDWIEIYNNTDMPIDLTNYYLSDNFDDKKKWGFPAGTSIAADDYLIIWADDDVGQEGLHTNFKLSSMGEQLMISHLDGTVIDSFSFGEQIVNIPSARIPNGTGNFVTNNPATFGYNNEESTSVSNYEKINFGLYPNPSNNKVTINLGENIIEKGHVDIRISNVLGEIVYAKNSTNELRLTLEVQNWSTGMYLVEVLGSDFRGVKKLMVE